jgi:glycosyltransferase involved in cell wall biosynthesis
MRKPAVLMIVENNFPYDSRVRKEAYALKDRYDVTVMALRSGHERRIERVNGVSVIRLPELPLGATRFGNPFLQGLCTKLSYMLAYVYFTSAATIAFLATWLGRRYDVIHAHNPPETLVIVGLVGRLFGAKFVFDHHDLSPELYLTKFHGRRGLVYKMLLMFERASCRLADVIICTNDSYKQIEIGRHGVAAEKIFVVRNNPIVADCSSATDSRQVAGGDGKVRLLFVGTMNRQDGVENLMHALHHLVFGLGERGFVCDLVGGGESLQPMQDLAKDLGLAGHVSFKGQVRHRPSVIEFLTRADIGVEPAPENELNKHSTFIKVMEYMAAGIPVVAFDLPENRASAADGALYAPLGDIRRYAEMLRDLIGDADLRRKMGAAGRRRVSTVLSWDSAAAKLVQAYDTLQLQPGP